MVGRLGSFQEGICFRGYVKLQEPNYSCFHGKSNEQTHGIQQSEYHMQSATRMNNAALELKILCWEYFWAGT